MIVVSDQATDAGAASIPAPVNEVNAPFFVWEPWIVNFTVATAVGFESAAGYTSTIDSKAMRKVGVNEDIAVMVENSAGGDNGAVARIEGRILIKLH